MSQPARPRRWAVSAQGAVVVAAGTSLGLLTGHLTQVSAAEQAATSIQPAMPAPQSTPEPVVVTVQVTQHVPSEPIIVYRTVPATGSAPRGAAPPPATGQAAGPTTQQRTVVQPAPAPRPVPAPAPAPQAVTQSS